MNIDPGTCLLLLLLGLLLTNPTLLLHIKTLHSWPMSFMPCYTDLRSSISQDSSHTAVSLPVQSVWGVFNGLIPCQNNASLSRRWVRANEHLRLFQVGGIGSCSKVKQKAFLCAESWFVHHSNWQLLLLNYRKRRCFSKIPALLWWYSPKYDTVLMNAWWPPWITSQREAGEKVKKLFSMR